MECPTLAIASEGTACHKVLCVSGKSVGTGGDDDFCNVEAAERRCDGFKSLVGVRNMGSDEV